MSGQRKPSPDPDMPQRYVKMRRVSYDPDSVMEVTLRPHQFMRDDWEVYIDGTWIGTVGKYMGTLDRPISRGSRIVHRGKRRTLWHFKGTSEHSRSLFGYESRAEAIRGLLR